MGCPVAPSAEGRRGVLGGRQAAPGTGVKDRRDDEDGRWRHSGIGLPFVKPTRIRFPAALSIVNPPHSFLILRQTSRVFGNMHHSRAIWDAYLTALESVGAWSAARPAGMLFKPGCKSVRRSYSA